MLYKLREVKTYDMQNNTNKHRNPRMVKAYGNKNTYRMRKYKCMKRWKTVYKSINGIEQYILSVKPYEIQNEHVQNATKKKGSTGKRKYTAKTSV